MTRGIRVALNKGSCGPFHTVIHTLGGLSTAGAASYQQHVYLSVFTPKNIVQEITLATEHLCLSGTSSHSLYTAKHWNKTGFSESYITVTVFAI